MAGLLRCIVDPAQTDHQPDQTSAPETAPETAAAMPVGSLWSRQWLFLRRRWWNADSLTPTQRVASFGRGVILIAVAAFGLLIVVHNTLNLNARGMDAIAKLVAEFLLIPVGILALIIAGYGASQIVRSFVPNHKIRPLHDPDPEEAESEKFQLRDEDER
jgi:hypothetical protein